MAQSAHVAGFDDSYEPTALRKPNTTSRFVNQNGFLPQQQQHQLHQVQLQQQQQQQQQHHMHAAPPYHQQYQSGGDQVLSQFSTTKWNLEAQEFKPQGSIGLQQQQQQQQQQQAQYAHMTAQVQAQAQAQALGGRSALQNRLLIAQDNFNLQPQTATGSGSGSGSGSVGGSNNFTSNYYSKTNNGGGSSGGGGGGVGYARPHLNHYQLHHQHQQQQQHQHQHQHQHQNYQSNHLIDNSTSYPAIENLSLGGHAGNGNGGIGRSSNNSSSSTSNNLAGGNYYYSNYNPYKVNNLNKFHYNSFNQGGQTTVSSLSSSSVSSSSSSAYQQRHTSIPNDNNHPFRTTFYPQKDNIFHSNSSTTAAPSSSTSRTANARSSPTMDDEYAALNFLQKAIAELNDDPGQYDEIAGEFVNKFAGLQDCEYAMTNAMEDIFKMSIDTANFRYTGAKLYNLLHRLNPKPDSYFLTLLRFKLEDHCNEIFKLQNETITRDTALFLAELYMQIRTEGRIQLIAQNIIFTLKQLVNNVNADNIRCICMTLKLAGYDLSIDCPNEIDDLINQLSQIDAENPNKFAILSHVLKLQKNNWGRQTTVTPELEYPPPIAMSAGPLAGGRPMAGGGSSRGGSGAGTLNGDSKSLRSYDEPVFYGPDGSIMTTEEIDFISRAIMSTYDGDENEEEDEEGFHTLDNEETADYEKFLGLQNNTQ